MSRSRRTVRFGAAALLTTVLLSTPSPRVAWAVSVAADVGVVISDHPDPVVSKAKLTYTIHVTNVGRPAATATDVKVHDHLSTQQTYLSSHTTQGTCSFNAGDFDCALGSVGPGATVTIELVVKELAAMQDSTTVSVSTSLSDPVPANNVARALTSVSRGVGHSPKPPRSPKPSSSPTATGSPSDVTAAPGPATSSSVALPVLGAVLFALVFIALAGFFAWREHRAP